MSDHTIRSVHARRLWDSRGQPTVEAEVRLADGSSGRAIAPAGASTGSHESTDLRDGGEAFGGRDVRAAVAAVNGPIADRLRGMDATDQRGVDQAMVALDGTPTRSSLGANAIVACSMAVAHAAAAHAGLPLWHYLGATPDRARMPVPEIQIIGGGAHAGRRVDIQDYMIIATGAETFGQALDWTAEVYRHTGRLLAAQGRLRGVADEGGFWPELDDNEAAMQIIVQAIEAAGLRPLHDVAIALDVAASDFGNGGQYQLARESRQLDSAAMAELVAGWVERYPIVSVEDPLGEDDTDGMRRFTASVGDRIQVVGDDFVVTSASRIQQAAAAGACNTALIKPNQIGTLSETLDAVQAARAAGWGAIVSARSGETEDTTIAHLAVGWDVPQFKVGSFTRSERMAKWNEVLRIAEQVDSGERMRDASHFAWRTRLAAG